MLIFIIKDGKSLKKNTLLDRYIYTGRPIIIGKDNIYLFNLKIFFVTHLNITCMLNLSNVYTPIV